MLCLCHFRADGWCHMKNTISFHLMWVRTLCLCLLISHGGVCDPVGTAPLVTACPLCQQLLHGPAVQHGAVRWGEAVPAAAQGQHHAQHQGISRGQQPEPDHFPWGKFGELPSGLASPFGILHLPGRGKSEVCEVEGFSGEWLLFIKILFLSEHAVFSLESNFFLALNL